MVVCAACLAGTIFSMGAPTALVEELLHVSATFRETTHVSDLAHELADQFAHDAITRFHVAADRIDALAARAAEEGEDAVD
jgi:hypothetical protein